MTARIAASAVAAKVIAPHRGATATTVLVRTGARCVARSSLTQFAPAFLPLTQVALLRPLSSAASSSFVGVGVGVDDNNDGDAPPRKARRRTRSSPPASASATTTPPPSSPRPKAARRRTRSTPSSSAFSQDLPTLADFLHRSKVLAQYRRFTSLAKFVDGKDAAGGQCRAAMEEVRIAFRSASSSKTDALSKKMALAEGERRLRELQAVVGYRTDRRSSSSSQKNEDDEDQDAIEESYDEDSWINSGDKDDPRGRVGTQWPWNKS